MHPFLHNSLPSATDWNRRCSRSMVSCTDEGLPTRSHRSLGCSLMLMGPVLSAVQVPRMLTLVLARVLTLPVGLPVSSRTPLTLRGREAYI